MEVIPRIHIDRVVRELTVRANLSTLPTQLRAIVINACVTFGIVNLLQIVHIPLLRNVDTKFSN